jgi:hypothetical protein
MELNKYIISQLAFMERRPDSVFHYSPAPGHLRAIDFYHPKMLILILRNAMIHYRNFHGYFPDISNPKRYNEIIFHRKFFSEFKVPQSGNKLLTSNFIPNEIQGSLLCPPIVWHSPVAKLPLNDEIPDGVYYYKASHGSGFVCRIEYPLNDSDRFRLEELGKIWLSKKYGFLHGEWWYNTFNPELMLEQSIGDSLKTTAWLFSSSYGEAYKITAYQKSVSQGQFYENKINLNTDFTINEYQPYNTDPPEKFKIPSKQCQTDMLRYASLISQESGFMRVDFLLGEKEDIHLGEITFSPANAMVKLHEAYENEILMHMRTIANGRKVGGVN